MKDRILTLIIGMLVGAILATLGFFIYSKTLNSNMPKMKQMDGNKQMQRPSDGNREEPPEMPNQNGGTSPRMPASSSDNNKRNEAN